MSHEYETLVSAADSIAHKNGVDIGTAMMWARMGIADGTVRIVKNTYAPEPQTELFSK